MIKVLLDANLSPNTASFLRGLEFDVKSVTEEKLGYLEDVGVIKIAKKEKRIIITFDLDFGEIYHNWDTRKVGIIVLRLKNQTPENVNAVLESFFKSFETKINENPRGLVVVKETSVRFVE